MPGSNGQRELTRNQQVQAALQNKYLTRQRVSNLEAWQGVVHEDIARCDDVIGRGFWGRMSWLFRGK